jgi:uncharacterized protein YqjF (DUF2071 family)
MIAEDILSISAHRPWPLPRRPWVMFQRWHDLLFAHWRVPPEHLRPLVPRELELDVFDGGAWVGVIPFWMSHVRFRGLPPVPTATMFPELNVRTYVRAPTDSAKPGVYFFSLDAASLLAVLGAHAGAGLPYFHAQMQANREGERIRYRSIRRHGPRPAELIGEYAPVGLSSRHKEGLAYFVTERYCLYVVRLGKVRRIEIHHAPWELYSATADLERNSMARAAGIELPPAPPLLHYSRIQDVLVFAPEQIT